MKPQQEFYDIFRNQTNRQIIGDQLDNCYAVLKAYIEHAIQNEDIGDDINMINKDLLGALNFYISNYDYIQKLTQTESKFLRNLLFEIKHYRNNWAHSQEFTHREVHRIADTIQMLFDELSLNMNTEQYQKAHKLRITTIQKMSYQIGQQQLY